MLIQDKRALGKYGAEKWRIENAYTLLDAFENAASWSAGGGCTITQDTADTMKVVTAGGVTAVCGYLMNTSMIDGEFLSFDMKVGNVAHLSQLDVRVYVSGTSTARMYHLTNGPIGSTSTPEFVADTWRRVSINPAELTWQGNGGQPDPTELDDIRKIELLISTAGGGNPETYFRDMRLHHQQLEPGCVWIFDDGRVNTHDVAWPIMEANGLTGTIGVVSSVVGGTYGGYPIMTEAQLHDMEDAGWEMVNHSATHVGLATVSDEQAATEVQDCHDWLVSNGFNPESARHFIYPSGSYDTDVLAVIAAQGCTTARLGQPRHSCTPGFDDFHRLRSRTLQGSYAVADANDYLDRVADRGGIVILQMHSLVETGSGTDWYVDRFEDVAEHAASLGLRSYKLREVFPL